jgi:YihY family inner membrane protein
MSATGPARRRPIRIGAALGNVATTVLETTRGFQADRGLDLSASLAFATLLMLVPLVATFAIVLAAVFRQNDVEIINAVNFILPYKSSRITENLREFVESARTISWIGTLVLIAASLRLIFVVEGVINAVWGAPKHRGLLGRIIVYTVGLLVAALLLGVALSGLAFLRADPLLTFLTSPWASKLFRFLVTAAALTLLYRFMPNAPVSWSAAGIGGVTAAVGIKVLRSSIQVYFDNFSTVNLIYGSLAVLFIVLLSFYFFWVIILWSVELTHALDTEAIRPVTTGRGRLERAIRAMILMESPGGVGIEAICRSLRLTEKDAVGILARLIAARLVRAHLSGRYTLAEKPQNVSLSQIVSAVVPDLFAVPEEQDDRVAELLRPRFQRLAADQKTMLDLTLAELTEGDQRG